MKLALGIVAFLAVVAIVLSAVALTRDTSSSTAAQTTPVTRDACAKLRDLSDATMFKTGPEFFLMMIDLDDGLLRACLKER